MTPRENILANLEHTGPERIGLTFDRDRINDILFAGCPAPAGYTQKRWTEGDREFYDDVFVNIWVRMIDASVKG